MNINIVELSNVIIRGEKNLVFPLQIHNGTWIQDAKGTHVLDVRGWGHFQYADDGKGEKIQDDFGAWVVEVLNKAFEDAKIKA